MKQEFKEDDVKLSLENAFGEGVDLVAKLSDGTKVHILHLRNDGRIHRYNWVSEETGFQVDETGRVLVDEEHGT